MICLLVFIYFAVSFMVLTIGFLEDKPKFKGYFYAWPLWIYQGITKARKEYRND